MASKVKGKQLIHYEVDEPMEVQDYQLNNTEQNKLLVICSIAIGRSIWQNLTDQKDTDRHSLHNTYKILLNSVNKLCLQKWVHARFSLLINSVFSSTWETNMAEG